MERLISLSFLCLISRGGEKCKQFYDVSPSLKFWNYFGLCWSVYKLIFTWRNIIFNAFRSGLASSHGPITEVTITSKETMVAIDQKLFIRLAGIDLFKLPDTVGHILFSQIFSLKLIFQKVFNTGLFIWLIHLSSVPPVKSGKSLGWSVKGKRHSLCALLATSHPLCPFSALTLHIHCTHTHPGTRTQAYTPPHVPDRKSVV